MLRSVILPLLAAAGLTLAILTVRAGSAATPVAQPVAPPPASPYPRAVAASGLIEAASENTAVSTPVAGLVTRVFVQPGSVVRAGDPLFQLDRRAVEAEQRLRVAALETARRKVERLAAMPRAEDLPPLEAQVRDAQAALEDEQTQLAARQAVTDPRAVSREEIEHRRQAVRRAQAQLDRARAQLAQTRAGAWRPELDEARAEVAQAEASVQSTAVDLERLTVRAPIAGECLQVKIHAGEYAQPGPLASPLILLGATSPLAVRVDIDEYDIARVRAGAPATAYLRGRQGSAIPLRFVRFEPFVLPKQSLTGDSAERVDTRVLQAIYHFDPAATRVFVGQQVDVFLQAEGPEGKEN